MLAVTTLSRKPLTAIGAIEISEVIVRGTIDSISEGRSLYHNNEFSHPIHMILIKFRVSKSLKGPCETDGFVYFEYMAAGIPMDHINKNKYRNEIIVLLKTPGWDKSSYTMIESSEGMMGEVDTLYELTTQRGLLIEEHAEIEKTTNITQPLEETEPLFIGQYFQHLEEEIPALSTGGSFGFDIRSNGDRINIESEKPN